MEISRRRPSFTEEMSPLWIRVYRNAREQHNTAAASFTESSLAGSGLGTSCPFAIAVIYTASAAAKPCTEFDSSMHPACQLVSGSRAHSHDTPKSGSF